MPDVRIREAGVNELGLLLSWREEVLHSVFSLPANADTSALMRANEAYYKSAFPAGKHIACFAQKDGETIGCGGLCQHDEMPIGPMRLSDEYICPQRAQGGRCWQKDRALSHRMCP